MSESRYKISNERLKLREYGRNVQMMVDYARQLEDRDKRNALSHEIVRIMGSLNPAAIENPDHERKLWDHFYHLAEFDIDIDSAFEIPEPEHVFSRPPIAMPYNKKRSRYRQYGRNIELMADKAMEMDDPDERHALVKLILNIMKMALRGQEKDSNAEIIVCDHLRKITKGGIDYQPEDVRFHKFNAHAMQFQQASQQPQQGRNNNHRNNKNNNRGKKKRRR